MNESHQPAQPAPVIPQSGPQKRKVPSTNQFFAKNTWNIFVYLLIGEFMALVIDIAFLLVDITAVQIIVTIVNVFAYCAMVSSAAWHYGNKDLNRYQFGHTEKNLKRGFWAGLIVSIYPLFFCVGLILANLGYMPYFDVVYKVGNGIFYHYYNWVAGGLVPSQLSWWQLLIIILPNVITVICTTLGYYFGFKDVDVVSRFVYRRGKQPQQKNPEKKDRAGFL